MCLQAAFKMQPLQPIFMGLHKAAQRGDEKETVRLLAEVRATLHWRGQHLGCL